MWFHSGLPPHQEITRVNTVLLVLNPLTVHLFACRRESGEYSLLVVGVV